jgi:hypothetical protein
MFSAMDVAGEAVFGAEAGIGGAADGEFGLGARSTASAAAEAAFSAVAEASAFPTGAAEVSDGSAIAILAAEATFSDAGETCGLAGATSGEECRSTCLTIALPPMATESVDRTAPT